MGDYDLTDDGVVTLVEPIAAAGEPPPTEIMDTDADGVDETVAFEISPGVRAALVDRDGDAAVDQLLVDRDHDGLADLAVTEDGEGGYLVGFDDDGDGEFETETTMTAEQLRREMPGVAELLNVTIDGPAESPDPEPEPAAFVADGRVIGDPGEVSEHWFQQSTNGYCGPAAIAQIVSVYTGVDHTDEQAFVELANQLGLWSHTPDGVPGLTVTAALELLEQAGVPADVVAGGNMELLAEYLESGRSVMLFVDSGEYWNGEDREDDAPDHLVVLAGIDTERGMVLLSDPGHPDGDLMEVPIEVFMDAWADSDHTMIVADEPAPDPADEPARAEAGVESAVRRPWALLPVTLLIGTA